MITLSLAAQLKEAGLTWKPKLHDFFAVPDGELQERVFVVSEMTIDVQQLFGRQLITFNGAVEWSLDYIMMIDVVWMPTEAQLRDMLQDRLLGAAQPSVQLLSFVDGYECRIRPEGEELTFEALSASEAYGLALLHLLLESSGAAYEGGLQA
jgi:hypothetical protein